MENDAAPQLIGEQKKFYGYIHGLSLEAPRADAPETVPTKLFATFENRGVQTVWCVPDHDLFTILGHHLACMARLRSVHGDYGYSKLWISKENGQWVVDHS
jgi:hypothetical protein